MSSLSVGTSLGARLACGLCLVACYGVAEERRGGADGTSDRSPTAPAGSENQNPGNASAGPIRSPALIGPRLVRLTPSQLEATTATFVPGSTFASDITASAQLGSGFASSGSFSTAAGRMHLTPPHVRDLYDAFVEVAALASTNPERLHPCLLDGIDDRTCIGDLVDSLGAAAWRRPVDGSERDSLLALWTQARTEVNPTNAFTSLTRAMLMSPAFLFRSELGESGAIGDRIQLTPHEVAAALSYVIANGPPDEQLRAAIASGLLSEADIETHARRLLRHRDSAQGIVNFLREFFDISLVRSATKDAELYPDFDLTLTSSMERETETFLAHVLVDDDGRLSTMLTASYSFIDEGLARLYGVAPPPNPFDRVALDPEQRSGVLTHASFLAGHAHPDETSIVIRGRYVRLALLCGTIPPPPPSVDANLPPRDRTEITHRDHIEIRHSVDSCAGCHSLMDPLGYAFEQYDTLGRFRTEDHGLTIDPSGTLGSTTYADARDLTSLLAESEEVRSCFARRFVQYATGVDPGPDDAVVARARDRFVAADGDVRELVVAVVTDEVFRTRKAGQ